MKTIIAFCGLSGTGKSTIARALSKELNIPFVITYTTRPIRPGEKNGVDYHFINDYIWFMMDFSNQIVAPQMFQVANGDTWKYCINGDHLKNNLSIMVLTPSGVSDLKDLGYNVISIYVKVDEELRLQRILERNDNQGPEEIKRRTQKDRLIFENFDPDYVLYNNGPLDKALKELSKITI